MQFRPILKLSKELIEVSLIARKSVVLFLFFVLLLNTHYCMADGDLQGRIDRISVEIKKYPDSLQLIMKRGDLYRRQKEFFPAFEDYQVVLLKSPEHKEVNFSLSLLYLDHKFYNSGLVHINRYMGKQSGSVEAHLVRAELLENLKYFKDASTDYQYVIENYEKPRPSHYLAMSRCTIQADSANWKQSIQWLEKGKDKLGDIITLEQQALKIEMSQQEYQAAIARVDEILADLPRKEKWLYQKGLILKEAGKNDEAVFVFKNALDQIDQLKQRFQETMMIQELKKNIIAELDKK